MDMNLHRDARASVVRLAAQLVGDLGLDAVEDREAIAAQLVADLAHDAAEDQDWFDALSTRLFELYDDALRAAVGHVPARRSGVA